jgi:hypothetical protein
VSFESENARSEQFADTAVRNFVFDKVLMITVDLTDCLRTSESKERPSVVGIAEAREKENSLERRLQAQLRQEGIVKVRRERSSCIYGRDQS